MEYSHKEFAYFVCGRYWVERTFDNAKNELGMSDNQVRKWNGWHSHHCLVMLAYLFIMKQQIDNPHVPLLSYRDTRILILLQVFGSHDEKIKKLTQMQKRHRKRQQDIDINFRVQEENKKSTS